MRSKKIALRINSIALVLSSSYLVLGLIAQNQVESVVDAEILNRDLKVKNYLATPTPFNILLWRVLIVEQNNYYEGFYSLLSEKPEIKLTVHHRQVDLLGEIRHDWAVRRLTWFTKGFFTVTNHQDHISVTDLRMGSELKYVFSFVVGKKNGSSIVPIPNVRNPPDRPSLDDLMLVWERI